MYTASYASTFAVTSVQYKCRLAIVISSIDDCSAGWEASTFSSRCDVESLRRHLVTTSTLR